MAESRVEIRVRDLELLVRKLETRSETLDREIQHLRSNEASARTADTDARRESADRHRELAVLRQRFDDHQRRAEEWNRHRWMLAGLVLAAVLTFAGNIAVALLTR